MGKERGWEHTERAIADLCEAGAEISEGEESIIFWEERSTLKAMGVFRCRGRNLAEVKRRLAELRRFLYVQIDPATNQWGAVPFRDDPEFPDAYERPPDDVNIAADRDGEPVSLVLWSELACRVGIFSHHPAMLAWVDWLCGEYLPAVARHGYYNPDTNHEPPPSQLLDAIERRAQGRDILNNLASGLGDRLVCRS
jgi:hypothetical protein